MAQLITIFSAQKPTDLFYVINEPKLKEIADSYLASNGCSAEYLAVSKDPDKAKCILKKVFTGLKFKIPSLDKPAGPISMIDFLEQLIARDYIGTATVAPKDRRSIIFQLSRAGPADTTTNPPNPTTVDNPPSPTFDSSFDDETLVEIARLENSKNALDEAIANRPVLEALNQVNSRLDNQCNIMKSIAEDVKGIKHEIQDMKVVQGQQAATLDQLKAVIDSNEDSKALCIFCATDFHRSETCIWRLMKCSECGEQGHSKDVHHVKDQRMKDRVREFHGKRKFSFI